jgi:hypothetical protein
MQTDAWQINTLYIANFKQRKRKKKIHIYIYIYIANYTIQLYIIQIFINTINIQDPWQIHSEIIQIQIYIISIEGPSYI